MQRGKQPIENRISTVDSISYWLSESEALTAAAPRDRTAGRLKAPCSWCLDDRVVGDRWHAARLRATSTPPMVPRLRRRTSETRGRAGIRHLTRHRLRPCRRPWVRPADPGRVVHKVQSPLDAPQPRLRRRRCRRCPNCTGSPLLPTASAPRFGIGRRSVPITRGRSSRRRSHTWCRTGGGGVCEVGPVRAAATPDGRLGGASERRRDDATTRRRDDATSDRRSRLELKRAGSDSLIDYDRGVAGATERS